MLIYSEWWKLKQWFLVKHVESLKYFNGKSFPVIIPMINYAYIISA